MEQQTGSKSGKEYIKAVYCHPAYLTSMWNAGLDEAQAGIKIARRNINNLRYAGDTTLTAESEEELKSLLMKVKEESETHSKHYPQWWKIESISSKVRNKTKVPTFTITIQHSFGSFGHSNQSRKRNKRNPNWKRRSTTLTVCRWHDPLNRKP